jgi:hypothetical protein
MKTTKDRMRLDASLDRTGTGHRPGQAHKLLDPVRAHDGGGRPLRGAAAGHYRQAPALAEKLGIHPL